MSFVSTNADRLRARRQELDALAQQHKMPSNMGGARRNIAPAHGALLRDNPFPSQLRVASLHFKICSVVPTLATHTDDAGPVPIPVSRDRGKKT
jgi:hypothetical protein